MLSKFGLLLKALLPISVSLLPAANVTVRNESMLPKAPSSMVVTELGMVIVRR